MQVSTVDFLWSFLNCVWSLKQNFLFSYSINIFYWRIFDLQYCIDFCHSKVVFREVTSVVSNSVRPQRRQPTRLPHPWDSPGKNTEVGYHFLLQCMKVKSESEVTQSCLTLSGPMDCSLPGSSAHGIFQARVLQWGAIALGPPKLNPTQ